MYVRRYYLSRVDIERLLYVHSKEHISLNAIQQKRKTARSPRGCVRILSSAACAAMLLNNKEYLIGRQAEGRRAAWYEH